MQCEQRNQATKNLDQIYRMRRFQFYDDEEVNRLVNLISLQSWYVKAVNFIFILNANYIGLNRTLNRLSTISQQTTYTVINY